MYIFYTIKNNNTIKNNCIKFKIIVLKLNPSKKIQY